MSAVHTMGNLTAGERAKMVAVLQNCIAVLSSPDEDINGPGSELMAHMYAEAGQAWINDTETFGVFDVWFHFSAGPNSVHTTPIPDAFVGVPVRESVPRSDAYTDVVDITDRVGATSAAGFERVAGFEPAGGWKILAVSVL